MEPRSTSPTGELESLSSTTCLVLDASLISLALLSYPFRDDGGELDPHGAENLGNPVSVAFVSMGLGGEEEGRDFARVDFPPVFFLSPRSEGTLRPTSRGRTSSTRSG